MTTARVLIDGREVARSEGGFADPLPLVLFVRDEARDGRLETTVAQAAARLAASGATPERVAAVRVALHALSAAGDAGAPLTRELAWAALPARVLLGFETRRTARGFGAHFPRLSVDALAVRMAGAGAGERDVREAATRARTALVALSFAAACAEASPEAAVVYALEALVAAADEPRGYFDALFEGRLPDDALRADLGALLEALGATDAAEVATADAARLREQLTAADLAGATATLETALARSPAVDAAHPLFAAGLEAASTARERGDATRAVALLRPLVWRAPETMAAALTAFDGLPGTSALDAVLASALAARAGDGEAWRARAVALGATLLDAGQPRRGLAVMRVASDVDCDGEAQRPLVAELRRQLAARYGLAVPGTGSLDEARFLLDAQRHRGGDDATRLARLLFDAIVGSLYEPGIADTEEREAFFELRIAPGLSYLEHEPVPGGGRVRPRRERGDESGPGLLAATLFLLGLGAVIALIGYLLLNHAS